MKQQILRWGQRVLEGTSFYQRAVQQLVFRYMIQENMSKWVAKPVYVVTKLGIPQLLSTGPRSLEEIAKETGTHPDALGRVLDALCGVGIFRACGGRRYGLDHLGSLLASERLRRQVLMMNSEWHDRAWSELLHSVKTGQSAFEHAFGMDAFGWFSENPQAAKDDSARHACRLESNYAAAAQACNFGAYERIVDVGGGHGELLVQILKQYPRVRGILADLPHVVERGQERVRAAGCGDRCEGIPSNFFHSVPDGADLYILHQILHDWDDADCLRILENCGRAMGPRSRLLVIEVVIGARAGLPMGRLLDLEMLVMGGGRERTEAQFRSLFSSAGLELLRLTPFKGEMSVFELRLVQRRTPTRELPRAST